MLNQREILLIEDDVEDLKKFVEFLKGFNLQNKFIHAWNVKEAISILFLDNLYKLKLIVIKMIHASSAHIKLIERIRNNILLKSSLIVVISNAFEEVEYFETNNIAFMPASYTYLDFLEIISFAGYSVEQ